jgi:probable HAF family extracellular repeat protein
MDLGALPGYPVIHGNNINDRGQIVGQACKSVSMQHCTVFLWQNGVKIDLNTVVSASSSLHMFDPGGINSRGEIVGLAIEKPTGQLFLATPCDDEHANEEGCEDRAEATTAARGETSQDPKLVIPENVRKVLLQRWGFRRFASSPQNVTLSDTAAASRPNVTLSPTSLTFPTQVIGTVSTPKIVTLKNTGTARLTITNITITGTNVGDFAQTHTCGRSLAVI